VGATDHSKRHALVFDIETIADLTPATREAIAALAKGRDMTPEDYGGLCPPLARVACIAWFDVTAQTLSACFDATLPGGAAPQSIDVEDDAGGVCSVVRCEVHPCDGEHALLRAFGQRVAHHMAQANTRLVTYNGRGFDLPVLVHRGIKHDVSDGRDVFVKAARENRYNPQLHIDIMDVVTFNGGAPRWPMAAYAVGYGFKSPKDDMDGSHVWPAVQDGRILDVVRYCAGDVIATTHVYCRLQEALGTLKP